MNHDISNPVFVNTSDAHFDLSGVDSDHYSLDTVIRVCDDPNIVLSKESSYEKVIESVSFILRTIKGNKLVANTKSNKVVFSVSKYTKFPDGVTINDFMLYSAKEFLTRIIYPKYHNKDIVFNAIPTPFGVIQREDGTNEALFQIVINHEVLTELGTGYAYVPVEDYKNSSDFYKIYQQFKFTKED